MTDILERLGWGRCDPGPTSDPRECGLPADECPCAINSDASAEIKRLRAANTELQGIDATLQLALERAQRERDDLKADIERHIQIASAEAAGRIEAERERDEARVMAIQHAAGVAREYWAAVIAGHGHIPADAVEAMTKAAQEIEAAILWQLTTNQEVPK